MSYSKVDELCRMLVRLRLVSQEQSDSCQSYMERGATADHALRWLENKGILTSYQTGRIAKGELDGLVLGNYKLMYRNASGSFARVYRACDLRTGRMVGLKVLRQRWCEDPKAVAEFKREAELGKGLLHENIVPIFEIGQSNGQHFLSMEFVEGGNLRDFINIRKKLNPLEATKCVLDMASGLDYAFRRGSTHRDLKMTNVLMSSSGVAKLVDFGLAGMAENLVEDGESAQRALEYATLEKNTGAPRNDPRSDMYFLGSIYYELLTGIPPLPRTKDRIERSQFSRYQQVRPVGEVDPAIPPKVQVIVGKMMHLNPLQRYQSPGDALPDLRAVYNDLLTQTSNGRINGSPPGITLAPTQPGAPFTPKTSAASSPAAKPSSNGASSVGPVYTVMCIEDRHKNQDYLREYFSKHGFRVLVLSDLQRGLARLKTTPPDCMVIMGESLGEAALKGLKEAESLLRGSETGLILVLGEKQSSLSSQIAETDSTRVLVQPVTLRDLRHTVVQMIRAHQHFAE